MNNQKSSKTPTKITNLATPRASYKGTRLGTTPPNRLCPVLHGVQETRIFGPGVVFGLLHYIHPPPCSRVYVLGALDCSTRLCCQVHLTLCSQVYLAPCSQVFFQLHSPPTALNSGSQLHSPPYSQVLFEVYPIVHPAALDSVHPRASPLQRTFDRRSRARPFRADRVDHFTSNKRLNQATIDGDNMGGGWLYRGDSINSTIHSFQLREYYVY